MPKVPVMKTERSPERKGGYAQPFKSYSVEYGSGSDYEPHKKTETVNATIPSDFTTNRYRGAGVGGKFNHFHEDD